MEISIKLELNDEQFEKFQSSVSENIDFLLNDKEFKQSIKELFMQQVIEYMNSTEGKELAKKAVVNTSFSFDRRNYYSDFGKYLINTTSEEFLESCKEPFIQVYRDIIADKETMSKLMIHVMTSCMAHSLTAACERDMDEAQEKFHNVFVPKLDQIESRLNKSHGI